MHQRIAELEELTAEQARDLEQLQTEFERETMFHRAKRKNSAHLLEQCRVKLNTVRSERDNLRLQVAMLRIGATYPMTEFKFNPAAIILGGKQSRPTISA